jgi:hypothetical protein
MWIKRKNYEALQMELRSSRYWGNRWNRMALRLGRSVRGLRGAYRIKNQKWLDAMGRVHELERQLGLPPTPPEVKK